MQYAVIQLQGKQYKVSVGDTLVVPHVIRTDDTLKISDVLLSVDGDAVEVGSPLVKGKVVTLKVVKEAPGEKIRVAKYRAKSRYRRVYGHRQVETTLEVVSIK